MKNICNVVTYILCTIYLIKLVKFPFVYSVAIYLKLLSVNKDFYNNDCF